MTIERAPARDVPKPWGMTDLAPWSRGREDGAPVGELWFERQSPTRQPELLVKLLFTSQALSIQVHPDNVFAQSIGLARGKSEAWYVLAAEPGARVAVGLNEPCSTEELRSAIADGSIGDLLAWHAAVAGDVFSVPAGTIHAVGAGVIIAEIQQNSDATFRLADSGRSRELSVESGLAVAETGAAVTQVPPKKLSGQRLLLIANQHFVFERADLPSGATWRLAAKHETWIVMLSGAALVGQFELRGGQAIFANDADVAICPGEQGMSCLIAYTADSGVHPRLLRRSGLDPRTSASDDVAGISPTPVRSGSACIVTAVLEDTTITHPLRVALIGNYFLGVVA